MSQEQSTNSTPPLYDADATQTIPVTLVRNQKRYKVNHTIQPCSDEKYLDYDRALNLRVRVHPDKSVQTFTDKREAADFLYRELLQQVVGWGDAQGANVDDRHAQLVIEGGLLACQALSDEDAVKLGNAEQDRPWEAPAAEPIFLHCRFNGVELVTEHFPKPADTEAEREEIGKLRKRYEALQGRKKYQAGARMGQADVKLQSAAKPLGKIYDELFTEARNYQGRVPLWHKVEAVCAYFEEGDDQAGES